MAENNKSKEDTKTTIKLYCPSLSKIVRIVALEDQKLDLGSIARTFGLDPSTLKLNGHFVSRGVDLIASSVTWKSLLSFFSARGLSTGTDDSSALIVDGKLCKSGTKRLHDPAKVESRLQFLTLLEEAGDGTKPQHEVPNLAKKQKLKESSTGHGKQDNQTNMPIGLKRKHWLESISPFKRSKLKETYSHTICGGEEERGEDKSCAPNFPCGYLTESLKRAREDEVLVAASPCKRTR
ncbi:hypothetical protein Ancab_019876 [Ancistrocladus abbreviatus]